MIYNAVLVSGVQQSESVIHIHISTLFYFFILFFKNLYSFIYFLAALGLRCCARAFSSCSERGLLFIVVCGLLIAVASLVAEHGL